MLIRDCSNYKGLESGYYRIAVKKQEENDRLIAALEEVLSDENIKIKHRYCRGKQGGNKKWE